MCYYSGVYCSVASLRSRHNCHMEILCPSEGAYPLWPKPGRLSAGYAAAHTDFHAQHVLSFCCAYFATAASFLPVQGMGYPAACATLIRAASARVRIGSSVPGAIWHARCAEALAWRSKRVSCGVCVLLTGCSAWGRVVSTPTRFCFRLEYVFRVSAWERWAAAPH